MRVLISGSTKNPIAYMGRENYERYAGQFTTYRQSDRITAKHWAMDNCAFTNFQAKPFVKSLFRYQHIPGCLFVVSPDVVGDARATMRRFKHWQPFIHQLDYPVALAAQDGLENLTIPWSDFDALFIGGSTEWKLSANTAAIAAEAKRRGKWVHMGRVNSVRRLRYAQAIGCDSVDGTGYNIAPIYALLHLPVLQTRQHSLWSMTEC